MEWQDEGIILHTQALGERKQVVSLFTPTRGRCAGIFAFTQKNKGWVQCGGKVKARWGARLENHLGYWTLEPLQANTAFLLDAPGPLAALVSAATLCQLALSELIRSILALPFSTLYSSCLIDCLKYTNWTTLIIT